MFECSNKNRQRRIHAPKMRSSTVQTMLWLPVATRLHRRGSEFGSTYAWATLIESFALYSLINVSSLNACIRAPIRVSIGPLSNFLCSIVLCEQSLHRRLKCICRCIFFHYRTVMYRLHVSGYSDLWPSICSKLMASFFNGCVHHFVVNYNVIILKSL